MIVLLCGRFIELVHREYKNIQWRMYNCEHTLFNISLILNNEECGFSFYFFQFNFHCPYGLMRAVWKVSDLAYNRRETRDNRLLGRDPGRSRCHLHTSLKLFWSRPMSPWTSAAAYECAAAQSMDPWGYDQESFTGVWRWHQLLSGSLPNGRLSRVSHRLQARQRTFHLARMLPPDVHGARGCDQKKLYLTRSVAVTPAPVGSIPKGRLSRISHRL